MSDPLPSASDLPEALRLLARDGVARKALIAACRAFERRQGMALRDIRSEVTGPFVDALFETGEIVQRELSDGTEFEIAYRSKIARDFILAPDERPEFVWEPQTTALLEHLARSSSSAIIGGAYVGDQAAFVARAMPTGTCVALEPNVESAAIMGRNAVRFGVANLEVDERGLWSESGLAMALHGEDSHARPVAVQDGAIETLTVDDLVVAHGWPRLDVLMLDLEGGEYEALRGAEEVIAESPHLAVVFEVHSSYVDWTSGLRLVPAVDLLLQHGYEVFALRDFQSNLPMGDCLLEVIPLDDIHLAGPPHGFNVVAVRDLERLPEHRVVPGRSPKLLLHREPAMHHPSEWLTDPPEWLRGESS